MFWRVFLTALPALSGGLWLAGSFNPSAATEIADQDGDSTDDDRTVCTRMRAELLGFALTGGAIARSEGNPVIASASDLTIAAKMLTFETQWKRRNCDRFDKHSSRRSMTSYGSGQSGRDLTIKPGKPMVDARPASERW